MHEVFPGVDLAAIVLGVYLAGFLTLVLYLRREDRREGYPLEDDPSGRLQSEGGLVFKAMPKTFHQPFGWGDKTVPNTRRDTRQPNASRTSVVPGSPSIPNGDPMLAGVGPGSYAERANIVDLTAHGAPKIVPLRVAGDFAIARQDVDPRGFSVIGTDGAVGGTVADLWVDRAEAMIRYIEVGLSDGSRSVLLPITMAKIQNRFRRVKVDAITGAQFANVPALAHPEQVTFYEEERVTAYYGAGFLYATPDRAEPLL